MPVELRLTGSQLETLRDHVLADEHEHAAVLICGVGADRLLACRRVVPLSGDDLISRGRLHLEISPIALARAAKDAAREGATVVVCHSHPFGGEVRASDIDLETEAELCGRVLPGRVAHRPVGALIVGPDGFDARLWRGGTATALELSVDGRRQGSHRVRHPSGDVDDRDARQLLVWGASGQARLRESRVAVIGAGGTGSHVAMQLAHLGVGHLTLIDDDTMEASNLSRIVGASTDDIGKAKVDVLAASATRVRPELVAEPIQSSVLDLDASMLGHFDALVCCTDGHGSRALLSEVAAQYLVPLIDLGVEVQGATHGSRAGGGVRVVRPGDACLQCMRILDPALVREEFLTDEERMIERARGYLRGLDEPEPSVIALNGVVASLAVIEIIDLLVGVFGREPSRLLYRAEARTLTTAAVQRDPACWICGSRGLLGLGDSRPLPRRFNEPRVSSA